MGSKVQSERKRMPLIEDEGWHPSQKAELNLEK